MKAYVTENAAERESYVGDIFNVGSIKRKEMILNSLPNEWSRLHKEGYIHIHDLDAYGETYNCLALNILNKFPYEKFKGLSDSRKISKLFNYLIEMLTRLGNEQSGGMSFANFDIEIATILHKMNIQFSEKNKEYIKETAEDKLTRESILGLKENKALKPDIKKCLLIIKTNRHKNN